MSSKGGRGLTRKGSILEETLDGAIQSEVGQGSPKGLWEGSRVVIYLDLVDQIGTVGQAGRLTFPNSFRRFLLAKGSKIGISRSFVSLTEAKAINL